MKKEEISKRIEEIESELKELRTKLTEEDKYFLLKEPHEDNTVFRTDEVLIQISDGIYYTKELKHKSFILSGPEKWELKQNAEGHWFLIPTKK